MDNQKQTNREKFPKTAKLVSQLRAAFGETQIKVLWVEENGIQAGKHPYPQTSKRA